MCVYIYIYMYIYMQTHRRETGNEGEDRDVQVRITLSLDYTKTMRRQEAVKQGIVRDLADALRVRADKAQSLKSRKRPVCRDFP